MNRVKELRKRAGMMQKEVANAAGVARATISDWENGRKDPSGDRLFKLSKFFNVSTGVILGYEDIPNRVPIVYVDDGSPSVVNEVMRARERIRRDPERGVLFNMATDADIRDVRRAVAIMQALKTTEEQDADMEPSD